MKKTCEHKTLIPSFPPSLMKYHHITCHFILWWRVQCPYCADEESSTASRSPRSGDTQRWRLAVPPQVTLVWCLFNVLLIIFFFFPFSLSVMSRLMSSSDKRDYGKVIAFLNQVSNRFKGIYPYWYIYPRVSHWLYSQTNSLMCSLSYLLTSSDSHTHFWVNP